MRAGAGLHRVVNAHDHQMSQQDDFIEFACYCPYILERFSLPKGPTLSKANSSSDR